MLGGEQSGFMAEIGFETYQKILNESIRELKRTDFKELFQDEISQQDDFVQDCMIETDLEILIPDSYVGNIAERLSLYQRLDDCESESELHLLEEEMKDRFGPMPAQIRDLFITVRCRKLAVDLGFEKMNLKSNTLRCYFINKHDSPYFESQTFLRILSFIQTGTNKARLKQKGKLFMLIAEPVIQMEHVYDFLEKMHHFVLQGKNEAAV